MEWGTRSAAWNHRDAVGKPDVPPDFFECGAMGEYRNSGQKVCASILAAIATAYEEYVHLSRTIFKNVPQRGFPISRWRGTLRQRLADDAGSGNISRRQGFGGAFWSGCSAPGVTSAIPRRTGRNNLLDRPGFGNPARPESRSSHGESIESVAREGVGQQRAQCPSRGLKAVSSTAPPAGRGAATGDRRVATTGRRPARSDRRYRYG